MSIVNTIKHAPRWTWYTIGGVVVGVGALRIYKDRAAPDPTAVAGDGTTTGDALSGSTQPATTGSSPPGVIVPPIITGSDGGSASDLGAAFAGLVGGTIGDLSDLLGTVVTGDQANLNAMIANQGQWTGQLIDALAGAGSPPQPVHVNPSPVIVNMPPPPQPAPHTPAPSHPAAPHPASSQCGGEFPLHSDRGCYKVVCSSGHGSHKKGRWHFYKNGQEVWVRPNC